MPVRSVVEAADELGVSPRRVRQMLADGSLAGERVGRSWVIDANNLDSARDRRKVGRPWNPRSAWAVLAMAERNGKALSPVERSRAKGRLSLGVEHVIGQLAERAERQSFYAHPGILHRIAADKRLVRSGVSAVVDHGGDLISGNEFEGYVRASDADDLLAQFGLDCEADRPNVVLRIVDDGVWPFDPEQRSAGLFVVAADLLESSDPRSVRAGQQLLVRS